MVENNRRSRSPQEDPGPTSQNDYGARGPEPKRKRRKARAERDDLPPWLQSCEKDGRDQIIPNLANLMIALRADPDIANALAFDQMLHAPVLRLALPAAPNGRTTGGDDHSAPATARRRCQRFARIRAASRLPAHQPRHLT